MFAYHICMTFPWICAPVRLITGSTIAHLHSLCLYLSWTLIYVLFLVGAIVEIIEPDACQLVIKTEIQIKLLSFVSSWFFPLFTQALLQTRQRRTACFDQGLTCCMPSDVTEMKPIRHKQSCQRSVYHVCHRSNLFCSISEGLLSFLFSFFFMNACLRAKVSLLRARFFRLSAGLRPFFLRMLRVFACGGVSEKRDVKRCPAPNAFVVFILSCRAIQTNVCARMRFLKPLHLGSTLHYLPKIGTILLL